VVKWEIIAYIYNRKENFFPPIFLPDFEKNQKNLTLSPKIKKSPLRYGLANFSKMCTILPFLRNPPRNGLFLPQ